MKNFMHKKVLVPSYNMDFDKKLSLYACMGMFQDITNDHGKTLGVDRWTLLETSNAFWVITKVKMKIDNFPELDQKVDITTWTIDNSAVKFERDCTISVDKTPYVSIKSEWVALDATTRHIRPAKTIAFPFEMKNRKIRAVDGKYSNFAYQINKEDFCYSRTIFSTDIDVNNHVNNCFYSRFVLDCFDVEFLKTHKLKEYEIHFVNECREREKLNFYKLQVDENTFYVEARVADKVIIKAQLTF